MVTTREIESVKKIYQSTLSSLDKVLVGQGKVKKAIAASLLCDTCSKILLTGNTGVGKTTISNFLASGFQSERISVTSDMIPSDIQEQLKRNQNINFLQVDEFNRASGKVQSTFIELFAEKQMSVAGQKYKFGDFHVFATQNSADIAGIFNVPQAVYDRFDMNIYFDSLTEEDKRTVLFDGFEPATQSDLALDDLMEAKLAVDHFELVKEDKDVMMQVFNLIEKMQYEEQNLFAGSNIRAHKFALKLAKLMALSNGRNYVLPADIIDFVNYVYMHRIDQNVAKINAKGVEDKFDEVKNNILSLKRKSTNIFLRGK